MIGCLNILFYSIKLSNLYRI